MLGLHNVWAQRLGATRLLARRDGDDLDNALLEQFEGLQRSAHQGAGAAGRANGRASRATHRLRSAAPASTLDTIRARLMQLPTEEAVDDSVSLDSNEERSLDETADDAIVTEAVAARFTMLSRSVRFDRSALKAKADFK